MDENMASEMQAAAESFTEDLKSGAAPSLVFGEEAPAEEAQAQAQPQTAEESLATSDILSEEEKRQVADFSKKIDITNTKAILEYGGGVQNARAHARSMTIPPTASSPSSSARPICSPA